MSGEDRDAWNTELLPWKKHDKGSSLLLFPLKLIYSLYKALYQSWQLSFHPKGGNSVTVFEVVQRRMMINAHGCFAFFEWLPSMLTCLILTTTWEELLYRWGISTIKRLSNSFKVYTVKTWMQALPSRAHACSHQNMGPLLHNPPFALLTVCDASHIIKAQ